MNTYISKLTEEEIDKLKELFDNMSQQEAWNEARKLFSVLNGSITSARDELKKYGILKERNVLSCCTIEEYRTYEMQQDKLNSSERDNDYTLAHNPLPADGIRLEDMSAVDRNELLHRANDVLKETRTSNRRRVYIHGFAMDFNELLTSMKVLGFEIIDDSSDKRFVDPLENREMDCDVINLDASRKEVTRRTYSLSKEYVKALEELYVAVRQLKILNGKLSDARKSALFEAVTLSSIKDAVRKIKCKSMKISIIRTKVERVEIVDE